MVIGNETTLQQTFYQRDWALSSASASATAKGGVKNSLDRIALPVLIAQVS
ncbi:hypothetical protein AVDCRST_MAG81-1062 [uncultured Synechococcales cyanobacterium]|uniref:Uncharacterized protein n=1 Tax=uncultured Synechococcales cyanobacterium TaxID=1936017 RepID=A0A6J4V1I2_9CYAN|nr:hypothetical protein AVDCRST_MAG81-1062 [uncultured Synechococcales cyanobacterium]